MCFDADIAEDRLAEVIGACATMLTAESVEAADPGLAVVAPERLADPSDSWPSVAWPRSG